MRLTAMLLTLILLGIGCHSNYQTQPRNEPMTVPGPYPTNVYEKNIVYSNNANEFHPYNHLTGWSLSKRATKAVAELEGIRSASVMVLKNQAYVVVTLSSPQDTLGELRRQITLKVKAMEPAVKRVFISVNSGTNNT